MTRKDFEKDKHEADKLAKKLRHHAGDAIVDYHMISEGDRVMVCVSGGKDSMAMIDILMGLQKNAPIHFELVAVNLDQSQPGFPADILPAWFKSLGVDYHIVKKDTYSVVKRLVPEGQTMCSLCSRMRRGNLYAMAKDLGATKIALGHHRDDMLVTLFLNMFYGGSLKTMPPKLVSDDGQHTVIRPLAYCREKDLEQHSINRGFPIIPCTLCGSQPDLQRAVIKKMLQGWDKQYPGRLENMARAMAHVTPSHLLDRTLFDFANLAVASPDVDQKKSGSAPFDGQGLPVDKFVPFC